MVKYAWVCGKCQWLSVSDSTLRHQMDYCKCGESAVDLEEHYSRCMGVPIFLLKFEKGKWTALRAKRKVQDGKNLDKRKTKN